MKVDLVEGLLGGLGGIHHRGIGIVPRLELVLVGLDISGGPEYAEGDDPRGDLEAAAALRAPDVLQHAHHFDSAALE
jgi:hypothetical protein